LLWHPINQIIKHPSQQAQDSPSDTLLLSFIFSKQIITSERIYLSQQLTPLHDDSAMTPRVKPGA
jgi:hypothetical protein